jgi:hypothetical protein
VASGDSDFSPLVSKLKENDKYVIGLGVKNSTSDLLIENCDEFIFYEDLVRGQQRPIPVIDNLPQKQQECFGLLVDSLLALQRENKEILWGSMVKETMKRKKPSFNETYYGFRSFSHLLEDAQRRGIVTLRRDQRSGSYIIEDLGSAAKTDAAATTEPVAERRAEAETEAANGARPSRRRRGRGGRGRRAGVPAGPGAVPEAGASGADEGDEEAEEEAEEGAIGDEPERPAPSAADEAKAAAPPDRPSFSLFSWLKREGEAKKPS